MCCCPVLPLEGARGTQHKCSQGGERQEAEAEVVLTLHPVSPAVSKGEFEMHSVQTTQSRLQSAEHTSQSLASPCMLDRLLGCITSPFPQRSCEYHCFTQEVSEGGREQCMSLKTKGSGPQLSMSITSGLAGQGRGIA